MSFEAEVPALGYAIYTIEQTGEPVAAPRETEGTAIENDFYRVEMDQSGAVVSLFDKELGRELVRPGQWRLNQLIHEVITSPGAAPIPWPLPIRPSISWLGARK